MRKISAVGLFCLYKFENNQTRTCTTFFRMSKLTEPYFSGRELKYEFEYEFDLKSGSDLILTLLKNVIMYVQGRATKSSHL